MSRKHDLSMRMRQSRRSYDSATLSDNDPEVMNSSVKKTTAEHKRVRSDSLLTNQRYWSSSSEQKDDEKDNAEESSVSLSSHDEPPNKQDRSIGHFVLGILFPEIQELEQRYEYFQKPVDEQRYLSLLLANPSFKFDKLAVLGAI